MAAGRATWSYYFTVDHAHDGDTIDGDLDMGLDLWLRSFRLRLAGVDAPELGDRRPEIAALAVTAQEALAGLAPPGAVVFCQSVKWDNYAQRVDADVYLADGTNVATVGLQAGWLRPYTGGGPKPW